MRRKMIFFLKERKWKWILGLSLQIYMVGCVFLKLEMQEFRTGFTDLWIYSFMGTKEYVPNQGKMFELPVLWTVYHVYLMYLVCDYLTESKSGYGLMEMIRKNSRVFWYISHWAVCVLVAVCYELQYMALCAATALIRGKCRGEACCRVEWNAEGIVVLILLPIAAMIAMVSIECMVESLTFPFVACLSMTCILICSVYWKNVLLPGNYAMVIRNHMYAQEEGLSTAIGVICCTAYIAVSLLAGIHVMKHHDILGKGTEGTWK